VLLAQFGLYEMMILELVLKRTLGETGVSQKMSKIGHGGQVMLFLENLLLSTGILKQ
jgi:hypothetical protein